MMGKVLGLSAGAAVVALGMWIIWMFRGVFPVWILFLAAAVLFAHPAMNRIYRWLDELEEKEDE
jgi:hypothetical protein